MFAASIIAFVTLFVTLLTTDGILNLKTKSFWMKLSKKGYYLVSLLILSASLTIYDKCDSEDDKFKDKNSINNLTNETTALKSNTQNLNDVLNYERQIASLRFDSAQNTILRFKELSEKENLISELDRKLRITQEQYFKQKINNLEIQLSKTDDKAISLKYKIEDDFSLYLRLNYSNSALLEYLRANKKYLNINGEIDFEHIFECFDNAIFTIDIYKKKEVITKNDTTLIRTNWLRLNSNGNYLKEFKENHKIILYQSLNNSEVDIGFSKIPLKISFSERFKSLDEFKDINVEFHISYGKIYENNDSVLSALLRNSVLKINAFALAHKYDDIILGCGDFDVFSKNENGISFKAKEINYQNLK